ncbi:organic cation transporter protein-like [Photinus pyralis]|uniref:Major facilitator superfamily (MFS) profile domain-containing protein n=1 Tax=Photinus pyralis TaxID=7054 RepID=A0A1Y1L0M4_PHOPY|nr:organic cation transporter protein-like [Photinus pyralis]
MDKNVEGTALQNESILLYGSCGKCDETDAKKSDILTTTIGSFGKWQFRIVVLMSLLKIPIAWVQLGIVFIAPTTTEFWCKPPKQFMNLSKSEWKSMISVNDDLLNITKISSSCFMKNVVEPNSDNLIIPCKWGYEYNRTEMSSSIISEWDLVCDKSFLVEILQMCVMLAILLGMPIFGPAADKFGRKIVLMTSIWLQTLFGLASTLSPWFPGFFIFRFLSSLSTSGIMIVSFVMCIEVSSNASRSTIIVLHGIPFGLGFSLMGLLAYFIRDWRVLLIVQYVCCALYCCYYWFVPESPRWLLAVDRKEEAVEILEHAATVNRKDVSAIKKTIDAYHYVDPEKHMILKALKVYPKFRGRTLILSLNWLAIGCLYFGLYQLAGTLSENIYVSVCITGLISIPSNLIAVYIVRGCGRKLAMALSSLFTGVCIFASMATVYSNSFWASVSFFGCAMFGLIILYSVVHLFTGELYPTTLRNSASGLNMMFAKVGGMVSPFIIGTGAIFWYVPFVTFGTVAMLMPLLLIPLPETKNMELPELANDIEKHGT